MTQTELSSVCSCWASIWYLLQRGLVQNIHSVPWLFVLLVFLNRKLQSKITYNFFFIRGWNIANSNCCPNINCQPHHYKPAASSTNWNAATTTTVPGTDGAVPTTRWSHPNTMSTNHRPVTQRSYSCSDSHTAGSSCTRITTGRIQNLILFILLCDYIILVYKPSNRNKDLVVFVG